MQLRNHKLSLVTLGAVLVAAVVAYAWPLLTTDTCCRYAPMAEAFASGDWEGAFHPRFCIGLPIVAGSLRFLTGMDGYAACAVTATVAWALCIVPLFFLASRVFDERTAWMAVALYLVCPTILFWSLEGLRESFKVLGLLLMGDAVFRCREGRWLNLAEASAGLALLVFFKVDAVAYGLLLMFAYMCLDRFRLRSWLLFAELLVFLQPCCLLVYEWTGVWLPVFQYAVLAKRVLGW